MQRREHKITGKRKRIAILFWILLSTTQIMASPEVYALAEDSPVITRAKELIEIINEADYHRIARFIQENYSDDFLEIPITMHENFIAFIRDETKKIKEYQINEISLTEATIKYKSELTGEWKEMNIKVEALYPHKISSLFGPSLVSTPSESEEGKKFKTLRIANKELDSYIKNLVDNEYFSGSVLIGSKGKILFHEAYGKASKEFDIPNQKNTKFIIGSVNKMLTSVAILQLVEQGKLSLNDPVSKVLPGVLTEEVSSRITIEHLLTHSSGLGDFLFNREIMKTSRLNYKDIEDYLPWIKGDTLRFAPGTKWQYSNTGFLLLGAIIEKITDLSYDDYLKQNIYQVANMQDTGSPELDYVTTTVASTYEKEFKEGQVLFRNDRYTQVAKGTPAGGGVSTTTDLFNFIQSLISDKLLKAETKQLMITAKPGYNAKDYGYGVQLFDENIVGHTGGGPGTWCWVEVNTARNLTIIVLGNQNSGTGSIVRKIRTLYE